MDKQVYSIMNATSKVSEWLLQLEGDENKPINIVPPTMVVSEDPTSPDTDISHNEIDEIDDDTASTLVFSTTSINETDQSIEEETNDPESLVDDQTCNSMCEPLLEIVDDLIKTSKPIYPSHLRSPLIVDILLIKTLRSEQYKKHLLNVHLKPQYGDIFCFHKTTREILLDE